MIITLVIIAFSAIFARIVFPVPPAYRWLAVANFILMAMSALVFTALTGGASGGADSLKFFERGPIAWSIGFESLFQADFMYFLSGALQSVLPLNFLAFNMIGALLFGYMGLAIIMRSNPNPSKRVLLFWSIFTILPGAHLWHASFSKEAIQLFLIAAYFGLQRLPLRLACIAVLLLLRPHIGILLALAEVLRILLARKNVSDVFVLAAAWFVLAFGLTYLVERLGGSGLSISTIFSLFSDYSDDWRTSDLRLNDTSSILAYPDFFFRPYPLEVRTFMQLIVTIENVVLFSVVAAAIFTNSATRNAISGWLFLVFICLALPLINPNVGTAARKKQILVICALVVLTRERKYRNAILQGPAQLRSVSQV